MASEISVQEDSFKEVSKDRLTSYQFVVAAQLQNVAKAYSQLSSSFGTLALFNAVLALYRIMLPGWKTKIPDPEVLLREKLAQGLLKNKQVRGLNVLASRRLTGNAETTAMYLVSDEVFKMIMNEPDFLNVLWRTKRISTGGY